LTKNEKFIKAWEKRIQQGKKKYVLKYAITYALTSLIATRIGWALNPNKIYSFTEYYYYPYITFLVGGFIVGVCSATIIWRFDEEKYNELIRDICDDATVIGNPVEE
jgi:hypothetical protein